MLKERYEVKDRLGSEGFDEVFKVLDKKEGNFYTLKIIKKINEEENMNDLIKNLYK